MNLEVLDLDKYRDLPKKDVKIDSLPDDIKARLKEFNRYKNILPNPHSRIILNQLGDDTTSTFINANFIPNVGGNPKGYIAAQGPKETTLSHFWRMVWQEDCRAIVMVTGLMEGTKQKCARYWPSSLKSRTGTTNYGGIEVGVITGKHRQGYKVAELEISVPGGESRLIKHFWFDSWPDYGVPEDTTVVPQMLEEVKAWSDEEDQPWVVHCSAGIGRTGTFIGIDMGMDQLKMQGHTNVIDLVELMRQGRGGMVQTADQCEFVYKCLEDFAVAENNKLPTARGTSIAGKKKYSKKKYSKKKSKSHFLLETEIDQAYSNSLESNQKKKKQKSSTKKKKQNSSTKKKKQNSSTKKKKQKI